MNAGVARNSQMVAGLQASASGVHAVIAGPAATFRDSRFPLSIEGLEGLQAWLSLEKVQKAALLQGGSAWPWQVEKARRRDVSGPLNLAYWLEYAGPDALARVADDAAWQPVMLALRDHFMLFVVQPASAGGPYPVPDSRNTPRTLATMLAQGDLIAAYPKAGLERLIDQLAGCEPSAIEECLAFFTAESQGHWHNRARAKIARRLKHCALAQAERMRLVQAVEARLIEGRFTEQFKDQLQLMLHLDAETAARASASAMQSRLAYVQKYGAWLAVHVGRRP